MDFVRDRSLADIHVIITNTGTGSGGREYVLSFIGARDQTGIRYTLKAVTGTGDPEDVRRRQVLTSLRIGLLQYLAYRGAPAQLQVDVKLPPAATGAAPPRRDPWNSWVFSIRGSASMSAEESNRERQASGELSADRITPDWKLTFGLEFDQETEEFDLDEDEPVHVSRRERDVSWLVVKALGDHWSGRSARRTPVVDVRQHEAAHRRGARHRIQRFPVLGLSAPAAARPICRRCSAPGLPGRDVVRKNEGDAARS